MIFKKRGAKKKAGPLAGPFRVSKQAGLVFGYAHITGGLIFALLNMKRGTKVEFTVSQTEVQENICLSKIPPWVQKYKSKIQNDVASLSVFMNFKVHNS